MPDPDDGWAALEAVPFVPDALAAGERTAAMHAAALNAKRPRPVSVGRAATLLYQGWRAGKLARRRVRLTQFGAGEYVYWPVAK